MVSKGTTQGSVRGPHLFNLFLEDLETDSNLDDVSMVKYADDSTILVTVNESLDNAERDLTQFMNWTNNNRMKCNTATCKELVIRQKCNNSIYPEMFNIKQYDRVTKPGVALQSNCKFSEHVKAKLCEASKCLCVIRGLRKEVYGQKDVDLLINSTVLSKLTYGPSIYGASKADLVVMDCSLKKCHKRRYVSDKLSIYDILKQSDRKLYTKIRKDEHHPLYSILPTVKDCSQKL